MSSLVKRFCLALLMLPCAAWADSRTATVTMHASGTMTYDPVVYQQFGWTVSNPGPQAFDLTASMSFYLDDELPTSYGSYAYVTSREVTLNFQFDGKTYAVSGLTGGTLRNMFVDTNPAKYELLFGFTPRIESNGIPHDLSVVVGLDAPPGTFDPVALAAQRVRTGGDVSGYADILAITLDGNLPVYHEMVDNKAEVSLRVLSPVPEPAPCAMLAGGLLALGLRRRGRQAWISSTASGRAAPAAAAPAPGRSAAAESSTWPRSARARAPAPARRP